MGRWVGYRSRYLINGTSALIRETWESSLDSFSRWGQSPVQTPSLVASWLWPPTSSTVRKNLLLSPSVYDVLITETKAIIIWEVKFSRRRCITPRTRTDTTHGTNVNFISWQTHTEIPLIPSLSSHLGWSYPLRMRSLNQLLKFPGFRRGKTQNYSICHLWVGSSLELVSIPFPSWSRISR